jgi:gliding motility-associated lipoprotein GldH
MIDRKIFIIPFTFLFLSVFIFSCQYDKPTEYYYKFPNQTWSRFEYVHLEIPLGNTKHDYDIILSVRHTKRYPFKNLYINVIMKMPSGEERIMEYNFDIVKADGTFIGQDDHGILEVTFPLKQDIRFWEKGILKVEIEDLIPRPEITGIVEMGLIITRSP